VPDNQWLTPYDSGVIPGPEPGPGPVPPGPTPTPGPGVDVFGDKAIYEDATMEFSHWSMDMANPGADPRGHNPESSSYMPKFIKNSDGSWKIKNQIEIRWAITQDGGFDQNKLCTDFQKCQHQGFMQDKKDWGTPPSGLLMKAYYRINAVSSSSRNGEPHIEQVMKGQRSTTSDTHVGVCNCPIGCSDNVHCNCYCNKGHDGPARQKYEEDLKHTTGYKKDISGVNNNTAFNFKLKQWFGLATVVYNLPNGNTQMEHWTDETGTNNWKKTHHFEDDGKKWPPRGSVAGCNTGSDLRINFGGPLSVFRSDNLTDYDIKNAVIRSIDPTKPLMGAEHARTFEAETTASPENPDDTIYQDEAWRTEEVPTPAAA
jgi:hypothetical protein